MIQHLRSGSRWELKHTVCRWNRLTAGSHCAEEGWKKKEKKKKGKKEWTNENRRQAQNSMKNSGPSTGRNTFRVYIYTVVAAVSSVFDKPSPLQRTAEVGMGWKGEAAQTVLSISPLHFWIPALPPPLPCPPLPPQGRIKLNWSPSQRPEFSRRPSQTVCRIATNFTSGEFAVTTTLNYK